MSELFLKRGERGVIIGASGSGKTKGAIWHLRNTALSPVIVFDTKGEDFAVLPREFDGEREQVLDVDTRAQFDALRLDELPEYVIVRPSPRELADPDALDGYLQAVYERFRPAFVYIDEAYQFHRGANAGPGFVGLLTRGRSHGITTLVGSQRPAWLSRFAFTEAVRWYVYALNDARDRSRIGEFIPGFDELPALKLGDHHFYYHHIARPAPQLMAPVPLYKPLPAVVSKPGRDWL